MQSCLKTYAILSLLLQVTIFFLIFVAKSIRLQIMTTTIITLLSVAVVLLVLLLAVLVWRNIRQGDELRQKNDVIVREVRRNQMLIHQSTLQCQAS